MPMTPAEAQDLGNLINDLNPYFNVLNPNWEMDIYMGNPVPAIPPVGAPAQIEVEVDSRYPGQWNFAGQPQNINRALRIRYRYQVQAYPGGPMYYVEDYLLIGFQGTGAG